MPFVPTLATLPIVNGVLFQFLRSMFWHSQVGAICKTSTCTDTYN